MKLLFLAVFLLWRLPHQCSANSIQIYPKELYFGGTLTQVILTCQPSQSCTDTIKWFKGTTEVDTSPNKYSTAVNYINNYQTLTVNDAMEADAGTYHCQCTFDGTSVNSPTATVIHKYPVTFNNENNQIYYADFGKNVTLICEIEDYSNFQWQLPAATVIQDNSKYTYVGHNLTVNNLTLNDNHTFFCVGNNEITFAAKLAANVFVYKSPKVISTSSTDMSVDEGDSITFNCTAEGHPQPKINWLKTDGQLKTGATVIVNEGGIDKFTQWSSLTLTHISDSDKGNYLCSATSKTPSKQSGTDTATFTLTVNEPVNPLFQLFTIDKSHSSINISWLLSGVDSNMINVSWSTSNDVLHQVHSSNLSSIVLMDLVPDTLYLINAFVIGTDLYAGLNESTNQLETTSSSTVQETSTSTQITYSTDTLTPPIFTTTASDVRGTDTLHSTSTSFIARPTQTTKSTMEPSQTTDQRGVSGGSSGSISSGTVIIATVVLVSLAIVILVVLILVVIVKKSRKSNTKNIRSIEKAGSSRSSQVLLDPQTSINSQMSSPSIHSNTAIISSTSSDMPPGYFEGINYIPPHSMNCNSQGSTNNPLYSGSNSQIKLPMSNEFICTAAASQNEPFEMTDNPNFGVQLSQIPPVLGGNIPSMTYNEYCSDYPPYSGDSVSQVIASQSSNMLDSRQNHQFQYTDSTVYEMTSPYKKSQSEPPQPTSTNLPIYSNQAINSNVKKPEFGIVGNSQRGAVREHVVIKKR